jgi:ABC-type Fe3+-hydroxamate transport system substrate-binding protein
MHDQRLTLVMLHFTDKLGDFIQLDAVPKRIISLVPSQTELLYDLGLDDEVIGITKFCVHPTEWFKTKTRVGGTKTVNIQKVLSLNPDLIIANKEENIKEQVEELKQTVPLYVSDISTLEDALQMIKEVGQLVGRAEKAKDLISQIQLQFDKLKTCSSDYSLMNAQQPDFNSIADHPHQFIKLKTAYLIWKDPYMAAGGDTFIHDMLSRCGLQNVFETIARYPKIEISQLSAVNCQLLLLSSEPYPFKQKHLDELQLHLPEIKIVLVDGEMFSWYGSRLLLAAEYFCKLITPVQR